MQETLLDPLGVRVSDVDLAEVGPEVVDRFRQLLGDRGVIVVSDQHLDDEQFSSFLRGFGPLLPSIGETPVPDHPELNVISNVGRTTPPKSTFHVDTSYVARPPAYTALRAVAIPSAGGQTQFSNQYRAYDTLGEQLRSELSDTEVQHVVTGVELGPDDEVAAWHPLFRTHPVSGRTSLYLTTATRCAAVSGMTEDDGRELIDRLLAHSTRPDNLYAHQWSAGDVVMWDNGCVLHRADHSGVVGDRIMHRGMVDG